MMIDTLKKKFNRSILRDRSGNFGTMTALLLPVVLGAAGIGLDMTHMIEVKSELQNAADSAALAAASAMSSKGLTEDDAMELARNFLAAQMANQLPSQTDETQQDPLQQIKDEAIIQAKESSTGGAGKLFDVTVDANYEMPLNGLTSLLGFSSVNIKVTSSSQAATESKNALSMYLVLDRSGSMGENTDTVNVEQPTKTEAYDCSYKKGNRTISKTCYREVTNYVIKIDALKSAVADLTTQLDTADPDMQYVRTAAISYNSSTQTPTSFAWGTETAQDYVDALTATGGTASTGAVKKAYQVLSGTTEDTAHAAKNGQVPSKFIVFMTDGDNNNTSDDTATIGWCDSAKAAGIEIYTVAFMAPSRGQALLQTCASSTTHYYDANDAEELVAAFQNIGQRAVEAATRLTN